jgi:putative heme iron utilization protein
LPIRAVRCCWASPARAIRWRNPKSKLYAGFADFSYFRLEPSAASLNGGFGKAYTLSRQQLLTTGRAVEGVAAIEASAVEHMNRDHPDAVARYARHFGNDSQDMIWTMTGIDAEGFDLTSGERNLRVFFDAQLEEASDVQRVLVKMSNAARKTTKCGPQTELP